MRFKFLQPSPLAHYAAIPKKTNFTSKPLSGLFCWYSIGIVSIILSLFYLEIPNYIYTLNDSVLPKYFYYTCFLFVTPLLFLKLKSFKLYMVSPFFLWASALVILNFVHFMLALIADEEIRANLISTKIQFIVLALLLGFACSFMRSRSYERIFVILTCTITALVMMDFFSPGILYPIGTEGTVLGRAAATFINPTKAGEAILLTFLLAFPVVSSKYRTPILLLAGTGIILTFSRGAILAWMLFWIFLLVTRKVSKYSLALLLVILIALPLLLGSFENYLYGREEFEGGLSNLLDRLAFFQAQAMDGDSAQERAEELVAGFDLFLRNPIFGAGAGATHLWSLRGSTHNQTLMIAAEYGVFGLALLGWLSVLLWKGKYFQDRRFQSAAVAGFIFMSVFTHNMFDFPYWLLTFALVCGQRRA